MINVTFSNEQVFSIIEQLPKEKKKELLEQLLFEEWLDSPEALKLKAESEASIKEGKVFTIDQVREKLRANGKDI